MSVKYVPVQWNNNKYFYDAIVIVGIMAFLWVFVNLTPGILDHDRAITGQIHNARAFGACAFFMLTVILMIGPLARLDTRFLPLLYNRRHFGVLTVFVASTHASFILNWYFIGGPLDKYEALLASNTSYSRLLGFPFEAFGIFTLLCLMILAATSHDFWMKFLTPRVWKSLHFLIYPAYASLVAHIGFGVMQDQTNPVFGIIVVISVALTIALHLMAARAERGGLDPLATRAGATWETICKLDDIAQGYAKVARLGNGERVAVFRNGDTLSAISNACAHQNGPLGEGKILDCLVTCPWHGFQYDVTNGRSPAPFTETVPTYRVRVADGQVQVDPDANPPGTFVAPYPVTGAKT
jgi:nitrite reductase/ring-hydroxylating ferredoxin subunit/DMSO/TMAO reductase YedYZ heme-binding membrane subunit